MSVVTYENLALDWYPESKSDHRYNIIVTIVLVVLLLAGLVMSSIDLPKEERTARREIPERIAKFILEKEKKQINKPKPKVKPKEVLKKIIPKIKKQKKKIAKPLNKKQKQARDKAKDSGLLALGNELADLIDTSDVTAMIGGKVKKSTGSTSTAASTNKALLVANATSDSGGISNGKYVATVSNTTKLSQREITKVRQTLLTNAHINKDNSSNTRRARNSNIRAEEDITIIFDQNKGKLYSIYNRARRKNPGLKGKIVLEISIAPNGLVTKVTIITSELHDEKLERRLVSRVKQFKFEAREVEPIVVTYPIEFLPS